MISRRAFLGSGTASLVLLGGDAFAEIVNEGRAMQPSVACARRPEKISDMTGYLKWKWRMDVTSGRHGLRNEVLKKGACSSVEKWRNTEPWPVVRAKVLEYLAENVSVGFSEFDLFPALTCFDRFDRPSSEVIFSREREIEAAHMPDWFAPAREKIWQTGGKAFYDYDHSAPDWDEMLALGFPGLKKRADSFPDTPFYRSEKIAAGALMRFLDRLIACAEDELARCGGKTSSRCLERAIPSLKRLRVGPPQTALDVMEFTFVYFLMGEFLDRFQVRTLGCIDRLWWPYYERDLAGGQTTESEFREDFRHFVWQFGSMDYYWGHPMYMGGTKADGSTEYNALSYVILDVIDQEALPTPKLQLKMSDTTPDAIWSKALDMLRRHRPIVLMGEKGMAASMKPLGLAAEQCRKMFIWGCFEWLPVGGNCTTPAHISMINPLLTILDDAKDAKFTAATFDDLKREYFRRLKEITVLTCKVVNEMERHLAEINPALILSLGVGCAMRRGRDAFSTGMDYNHTSICEVAFASAVDSLVALREFVYERRELSLAEFGEVLASNWKGREALRLRISRMSNKWGSGNAETDALGREVLSTFTGFFVGRPNARGGVFTCYGINSRGYLETGRRTSATPDGRMANEELSKNMAPAIGGDANGVTGVLRSWSASVDPAFFPCGSVLDMMIHASSVGGEKGLCSLRAICEHYFNSGGCALNLNIQSVAELKDAQAHPEKYENLQVRVAGWNIRWNDIPKSEQDGFIRRLEAMPR